MSSPFCKAGCGKVRCNYGEMSSLCASFVSTSLSRSMFCNVETHERQQNRSSVDIIGYYRSYSWDLLGKCRVLLVLPGMAHFENMGDIFPHISSTRIFPGLPRNFPNRISGLSLSPTLLYRCTDPGHLNTHRTRPTTKTTPHPTISSSHLIYIDQSSLSELQIITYKII